MTFRKERRDENMPVDVSIVLACYNAELYLEESFIQILNVLDGTRYSYEIILVDDKSSDATVSIIKEIKAKHPWVKTIFHRTNCGRGKTVFDGFRVAKGRIVGFIDVDLDNPARYIYPLVLSLDHHQAEVATAKRIYILNFNPYLIIRWILSRGYSQVVRWVLHVKLQDTETGCKFFQRDKILPILKKVKSRGWFWDTEVMVRVYFERLKILEMPTLFVRNSKVSTVDILPDVIKYFINLFRFKKEIKELRRHYEYQSSRSSRDGSILNI